MRAKKALLNALFSLLQQIVGAICGFIVPIAYISTFGSDTYGAIGTITQYLGFIALLEAGVGGVTRAALYVPLAKGDVAAISSIVKATESFFRGIGGVFIAYSIVVGALFPHVTQYSGDPATAFALTLVIAAGTLAQYMFGITYSTLLQADQRSYVTYIFQIGLSIANAVSIMVMISLGFDVVIVQGASAICYVLRPIALGGYVQRRYRLRRDVEPDKTAISDRWNGLGHHLAFYLRSNVAVVALSMFSPLSEVAVFTVYNLVAGSLQKIVASVSSSLEAAFGNMIARREADALRRNFRVFEIVNATSISIVFSTALVTILPFVTVYTSGVDDADYLRPWLAVILLSATAIYCFRQPYNSVVLAAGHYRQTRNGAFGEAIVCVACSFLFARPFGAAGVAGALLLATVIRTVQYGVYASRVILHRAIGGFVRQALYVLLTTTACSVVGMALFGSMRVGTYGEWLVQALATVLCSTAISLASAMAFYRQDALLAVRRLRDTVRKR